MYVAITELRANLSRYMRRVKRGEEIIIMQRGIPVGRLVPYRAGKIARRARPSGSKS